MKMPQAKTVYFMRDAPSHCFSRESASVDPRSNGSSCDGRLVRVPSNSEGTKTRTRARPAALMRLSCSAPDMVDMAKSTPCRAKVRLSWSL
jgi:hypothetical protein